MFLLLLSLSENKFDDAGDTDENEEEDRNESLLIDREDFEEVVSLAGVGTLSISILSPLLLELLTIRYPLAMDGLFSSDDAK